MILSPSIRDRRFLVPEVVQTSAMDCGPATLKSLLEGYGISVSYGRLREACQTDVDGTSIDTMEEVANQLGLEAEQIMIPADHLFVPASSALPAIVVVRQPSGVTHFVLAWRCHGRFIQVMDPSRGRIWTTQQRFLDELYIHSIPVPAAGWRDWAGSDEFCDPLRQRLSDFGVSETDRNRLVGQALEMPAWQPLAALDAATRMVNSIVRADGLDRGAEATRVLKHLFTQTLEPGTTIEDVVPPSYWSVQPLPPEPGEEYLGANVLLRGAVLVRVLGLQEQVELPKEGEEPSPEYQQPMPLAPELVAALEETPPDPSLEIFKYLKADGLLTPSVLVAALGMASAAVLVEALLLRGILDIGRYLTLPRQRIAAVIAILVFFVAMLLLELPISNAVSRMGRRLETRLRIRFLEKIPRLSDQYFHSRLTSDMTQRAHDLRELRVLPGLGFSFLRLSFQLVLTAIGVIWFEPRSAPLAILATVSTIGLSLIAQPVLAEQDLRLRSHIGALSRFYLDALLGLIPIRTHRAERSVRREHENLLVEWIRTSFDFAKVQMLMQAIQALVGFGFAVWIVFNYVWTGGQPAGILLLLYWALNLPALGQSLAQTAQQYPIQRNKVLRLLELVTAPDETEVFEDPAAVAEFPSNVPEPEGVKGVSIDIQAVNIQAGGHTILSDINLAMGAGEHVAIVGPSGAGKSSLVGVLLGWYRPVSGRVFVDGNELDGLRLHHLRRETAWVDPAVQLWNRTLLENLRYGNGGAAVSPVSSVIEEADLYSVLEMLPNGLQTSLGEGGGLVSGGEGQRVRLGRAMLREDARLVILDEPFRGLDRAKRRTLLERAREHWAGATLIFISHDLGETRSFERVVVIEDGQIVENDSPDVLFEEIGSRYRALMDAEEAVRKGLWTGTEWRHLWLENGKLEELPGTEVTTDQ